MNPYWRSFTPETALLLLLFCGHVLGDFLIQGEALARRKRHHTPSQLRHALETTVTHLVLILPLWSLATAGAVLALGAVHLLLDLTKRALVRRRGRPLLFFFVDQGLHAVAVTAAWRLALHWAPDGVRPALLPAGWLAPTVTVLVLLSGFVLAGRGGTTVLRLMLARYLPDTLGDAGTGASEDAADDGGDGTIGAEEAARGRVIGVLERWLLVTLVLLGQWSALGFVLAAKSLARFKDFEHRDFAEYYLIGTLASVLVALAIGLLLHGVLIGD